MKNEDHLLPEEEYLFHEEEFPVYEDKREFLERSKPSNRPRKVFATSPSEDVDDKVKSVESKYKKLLESAKKEFEEDIKEYQDQLAAKDFDILMLKVQLESLEQKSEAAIDDVIKKTNKHMNVELAKLKNAHELQITKLISESKAYYKQDAIDKEKEIDRLKKEIKTFSSEPKRTQQEQDLEIAKLKDEFTNREEQIIREAKKKVEQIMEEARRREKQLKEEAARKEEQILLEITPKIEKIINEKQQSLLLANQRYERLKQQSHLPFFFHNKKEVASKEEPELQKEPPLQGEVTLQKEAIPQKEVFPKKESSKEKTHSKNDNVDVEKAIEQERKEYNKLEKEVNKLNQVVNQLSLEKKDLNRKLDRIRKASTPIEEERKKPKTSFFELISTIILIATNLIFIFLIYPNMADWIEGIGLNHLSITIRILMSVFIIMISLFCFVKAKDASRKKTSFNKKKKETHSIKYLLGIISLGTILLIMFLVNSTFLFFLVGTLLIVLAGLLLVGQLRES